MVTKSSTNGFGGVLNSHWITRRIVTSVKLLLQILFLLSTLPSSLGVPSPDPFHRTKMSKEQRWFPLESNPDLINDYIRKLGFQTDLGQQQFVDVLSTDDWALDMVPQPVHAVILLYPLTPVQLEHKDTDIETDTNKVWFIRQRIGNACGTIGLLHALLNTPLLPVMVKPDSWLANFATSTANKSPVERAELLEADSTIANLHDQATSSSTNQTGRGSIEDRVETHFIALVHINGILYELDGRKEGPVKHGTTSPETLLHDACRVIKTTFMARDPKELRFSILALGPGGE